MTARPAPGPCGPATTRRRSPTGRQRLVKDNPYFKHAFVGPATMIPAKEVEVPCEETGCKMAK